MTGVFFSGIEHSTLALTGVYFPSIIFLTQYTTKNTDLWYFSSTIHSIEYWFRCLDIDGDGVLSLFELVYFYEEVLQRLQELNIDSISIENTICQVLDMVNPKEKGREIRKIVLFEIAVVAIVIYICRSGIFPAIPPLPISQCIYYASTFKKNTYYYYNII
jgi:hypothetical protein